MGSWVCLECLLLPEPSLMVKQKPASQGVGRPYFAGLVPKHRCMGRYGEPLETPGASICTVFLKKQVPVDSTCVEIILYHIIIFRFSVNFRLWHILNILSRSFAGHLKNTVELQQLLGSTFSANFVVDALCGIVLPLGYTKNIHSSNVIYTISRKKLGWSVEVVLGNLAKETVRAKKKHQTTALRAPHNMQHSFGKAGNAVCLHSSCVLRCKLQTSAFCNHCEYEYYFFRVEPNML